MSTFAYLDNSDVGFGLMSKSHRMATNRLITIAIITILVILIIAVIVSKFR